jgi:hypothetical protein
LGQDEDNIHGHWEECDAVDHVMEVTSAKELLFFQHLNALGFVMRTGVDTNIRGFIWPHCIQYFDQSTGLTIVRDWGKLLPAWGLSITRAVGGNLSWWKVNGNFGASWSECSLHRKDI